MVIYRYGIVNYFIFDVIMGILHNEYISLLEAKKKEEKSVTAQLKEKEYPILLGTP